MGLICVSNRKDTVMDVKVCLLNKITLVVVGDIYSRHMFRTLGTSRYYISFIYISNESSKQKLIRNLLRLLSQKSGSHKSNLSPAAILPTSEDLRIALATVNQRLWMI